MKMLILVNPLAGRGRGETVARNTRTILHKHGIDVVCCCSQRVGHLSQMAAKEVNGTWDGIVAIGGDGTLFEVVNGMMQGNPELPVPLGVIPVGSGNSFCRDLNINCFDDAIGKIIKGRTRRIDLGWCECESYSFSFINILGFGFVTDVARKAMAYKRWGDLSYIIGIFIVTMRLSSYPLEIELDGRTFERDNIFVEVCNSTKTGGSMNMAPLAKIDDGLLDVVMLNKTSRTRLISALPKLFKGTHIQMPEVETYTARQMVFKPAEPKVLSPDGEIFGCSPIRVSVLPGKLKVFDT